MEKFNKHDQFIKTYRSRHIHGPGIAALSLIGLAAAPAAVAQSGTLTTLASFSDTTGYVSHARLAMGGSTLYGTTTEGGASGEGTVYSVPITGGTPIVLASFNGTNGGGQNSEAGLTLSGSTLYGTTSAGGTFGDGTVFSVPMTVALPPHLSISMEQMVKIHIPI